MQVRSSYLPEPSRPLQSLFPQIHHFLPQLPRIRHCTLNEHTTSFTHTVDDTTMTSRTSLPENDSPSLGAQIQSFFSRSGTEGQHTQPPQSFGSDVYKPKLSRSRSPPLERRTDPWGFTQDPCAKCETGTVSRWAGHDWRDDDLSQFRPPSPEHHSMCPSCSKKAGSDASSRCSEESLLEGPTQPVDLSSLSITSKDMQGHPTTENRPSASCDSQQPESGPASPSLPTATGTIH